MGFQFRKPSKDVPGARPNGSSSGSYGSGPPGSGFSYSELLDLRKSETSVQPARIRRLHFRKAFVVALGAIALVILVGGALWFTLYRAPGPASAGKNQDIGLVTATKLNCRAEPSATSPVVRIGARGEKVVMLAASGSWQHVRMRGAECWASIDYVQIASPIAPKRK